MIKSIATADITQDHPLTQSIQKIVSRHRGKGHPIDLSREAPGILLLISPRDQPDNAVASLRYYPRGAFAYVNLVHTLSEYRGQGYSIALFRHLFETNPHLDIILDVEITNTPAISLYQKLRFQFVISNLNQSPADTDGDHIMMMRPHQD